MAKTRVEEEFSLLKHKLLNNLIVTQILNLSSGKHMKSEKGSYTQILLVSQKIYLYLYSLKTGRSIKCDHW